MAKRFVYRFKCMECYDTGRIYLYTSNGWWNELQIVACKCMKEESDGSHQVPGV